MPGGYGTDESTPWGSSGDSYVGVANNSSNHSSNNSSNNNYYSNPDKDYDDSWESQPNNYVEPYTPPKEIYGSGQIPPGTNESYEWTHEYGMAGPKIKSLIQGLSPETLSFWGINANSQTIPNELFQMLLEGSIVGSNEAMYNDIDPKESGIQLESGVGTWSDLEAGIHPSIPGGMGTYHQFMNLPTTVSYEDTFSSDGGGNDGGGVWRGSWPNFGNWGGSSQYGNPHGRYSKAGWHIKNKYNYDSPIAELFQQRRANPVQPQNIRLFTEMMANMNKGGIMGLRR
jgi:hypothetical protein